MAPLAALRWALVPLVVALATADSFVHLHPPATAKMNALRAPQRPTLPSRTHTRRHTFSRLQPLPSTDPSPDAALRVRGGEAVATGKAEERSLWDRTKVSVFILLWYVFNVQFNIYNKRALNAFNLPWAISVAQLGVGSIYALLLWLLRIRKVPSVDGRDTKKMTALSVMHAVSHITAITSLGAGAVSFTHIVKSMEPFFASIFAGIFLKQVFHPMVYVSLIPVVGGVSYASLKELAFSWTAFNGAMASNIVCAVRGVVVKGMMSKQDGPSESRDLTTSNMYSILTIAACLMLVPPFALFEGPILKGAWKAAIAHPSLTGGQNELLYLIIMSGITFFLYNEVAFIALESLHPISHAVTNTIKRVVIIVVSVLVFRNPLSIQSIIGSAIAILGVFGYSLAKYYFK